MRFRILAAAVSALALAGGALAQPQAPEFSPDRVRAHVTFLADDLLQGRDAGEPGYDLAALYVATRFAALGLEPAVNGSWYQQVPFQETRLGDAPAALTIGGTRFANGSDILVGPSASEPSQSIAAPVVFAGYGLDAPGQGFDDYAGLDVKGKVVAVLSGYPKGALSEVGAHLSSEKARMAERRGAVGMVTILTPAALKTVPWERRAAYADEPSINWVGTEGKPYQSAPGIRFNASLNTVAAEALFAGARRPLGTIFAEAEREGGKPKGFPLAQPVKLERSSASRSFTSPNVIAMLPGSDPALAGEYVMLTAHLDHEGVDETKSDKVYNGAMDNAAGIATMLEAARAMAMAPERPRRTVLFAAVTAEEDGLLGSQYLAKHPVVANGKLVGVVNLDMPVLLYDFDDMIAFGAEHSTLGPIVARATESAGVRLSPDPMPEQGIFTRSDHYRFVQEGVPSVMLMTGFANGGEKIWGDFFATHYHQPSDEIDLPFDWDAAAKFARINYLIAREIANAPEAPRWYADSFFGNAFAAGQEKAARQPLCCTSATLHAALKENRGRYEPREIHRSRQGLPPVGADRRHPHESSANRDGASVEGFAGG